MTSIQRAFLLLLSVGAAATSVALPAHAFHHWDYQSYITSGGRDACVDELIDEYGEGNFFYRYEPGDGLPLYESNSGWCYGEQANN